jgi:hypothetical protein
LVALTQPYASARWLSTWSIGNTHALWRLRDVEGVAKPSPIAVVFLDIAPRELDGAVPDLDTPRQMM